MPDTSKTLSATTARHLREGLRDLLLASTVVLFLIIFLVQPVRVEGTSMQPQLDDQERVFVSKITYSVFDIQRGDVVVFYFPGDPKKSFIKRVIGLPGEMVQIVEGRVMVNGRILRAVCPGHVLRQRIVRSAVRGGGFVFRAGRPPEREQRQPALGLRAARFDLRQGHPEILAAR